jgi:DNA repair photolyase
VRAFERRAGRPSGEGYGRSVRVKVNVADVLRAELERRSWRREEVAIGTATDPYQPAEGRYRLTRACIVALGRSGTPFTIVTRGPLVVRDRDVLSEAAANAAVVVCLSLPTLDEDVWRETEPGTAPPRARLRAISLLARAGLDVSVAIAPVVPGLSDGPDALRAVVEAAGEAGARRVWSKLLDLRPGTREHFLAELGPGGRGGPNHSALRRSPLPAVGPVEGAGRPSRRVRRRVGHGLPPAPRADRADGARPARPERLGHAVQSGACRRRSPA